MRMTRVVGVLAIGLFSTVPLAACGSSDTAPTQQAQLAALQKQADTYAIDRIEVTWHKAASAKDVNLMMSLWADNATFQTGTQTYTGKAEIRTFFSTKAAPFKPENHWVSDTPAYKVRITVDGNTGTLYFECHYVDATTRMVVAVVAADVGVARTSGRWLIVNSISATPVLTP